MGLESSYEGLAIEHRHYVERLGDRLAPLLKNTALDSELAKELLQSLKTREEGTGRQENFLEPVSPEPQSEPVP